MGRFRAARETPLVVWQGPSFWPLHPSVLPGLPVTTGAPDHGEKAPDQTGQARTAPRKKTEAAALGRMVGGKLGVAVVEI